MRVLHSIYSIRADTGGPARSVPALLESLQAAGVDARLNVRENASAPRSPLSGWRASSFASGLNGWHPELVHDHGLWLPSNHQAAAFTRKRGIPLVVSPRGMLEPWSLNHRRWKKRAAWWLYQRRDLAHAACLHATSRQEALQLRSLGLRQPIVVLPNGVRFSEGSSPAVAMASDERIILFMSRIHPKKGLLLLIEAWARLKTPNWKIRIVGPDEGGHAAEVRAAADKAGISDQVQILPAVDDSEKWRVLSEADVFILPTYSENFGIVVAEALAAEIPVITTTGTPWTELAKWGCGWCVEPTVEAIQDSLEAAIELPEDQRKLMGQRGSARVREQFSWPAIGRQMQDAYAWLLGGGTLPQTVWPAS